LAHIEGPEYVLSDKFDPIRDFITGRHQGRQMVQLLNTPILAQEQHNWRVFEGYVVVFQTEGRSLRGKVSMYNSISYEVMLCADLGLYYQLKSGHAFDPTMERVYSVNSIPFSLYHQADPLRLLSFFPLN
jgi:hypothetical protein